MHSNGNNIDTKNYKREGALHTKGVQHLSSVLCGCLDKDKMTFALCSLRSPSLWPEKETVREKSPKKLDCPCHAVCYQTAGLSCGCRYSAGLSWAPLRLVSAPHHTYTSHISSALDPAPGLGSWSWGKYQLYFVLLHICTGEEQLSHVTTWSEALGCDSHTLEAVEIEL